jgi:WD40 repeat protein
LESSSEPFIVRFVSDAKIEAPSYGSVDPRDISAATRKNVKNGKDWKDDGVRIEKYALGLYASNDLILCIDKISDLQCDDEDTLAGYIRAMVGLPSEEITTKYTKLSGHKEAILALDVLKDFQNIVSGSADGTIKIWPQVARYFNGIYPNSLGDQRVQTGIGHKAPVSAVAWSNEHKISTIVPIKNPGLSYWQNLFIISASYDKTIRLWSKTGEPICKFIDRLTAIPTAITWSFNNKFILVGLVNGVVEIWNVRTGRRIQSFEASNRAIRSLAFDHEEKQWIILAADNVESHWRIEPQDPKNNLYDRSGPSLCVQQ